MLYEKYLKQNKEKKIKEPKKTIIMQDTKEENNNSVFLKFSSDESYSAEINIVELEKFANQNDDGKKERWVDELEIKSDDILFIGRKII